MRPRIYQPARSAMTSGRGRTESWVLEFAPDQRKRRDPLMGWTGSGDTQAQVRLRFESKEAALDYARENGIEAVVSEPHKRRHNIRPGGYGDNFAADRRAPWTH